MQSTIGVRLEPWEPQLVDALPVAGQVEPATLLLPSRCNASGWSQSWEALFDFHSKAKEME